MIIVLEGPDCSGKSTLAKHLKAAFDCPVQHIGQHFDAPSLAEIHKRSLMRGPTIIDRNWFSELVYAFVMPGRTSRIRQVQSFQLGLIAAAAGVCYVICLNEDKHGWLERYVARANAGGEHYNDPHRMGLVYEHYRHLATSGYDFTIAYDWKQNTPEQAVRWITEERSRPAMVPHLIGQQDIQGTLVVTDADPTDMELPPTPVVDMAEYSDDSGSVSFIAVEHLTSKVLEVFPVSHVVFESHRGYRCAVNMGFFSADPPHTTILEGTQLHRVIL